MKNMFGIFAKLEFGQFLSGKYCINTIKRLIKIGVASITVSPASVTLMQPFTKSIKANLVALFYPETIQPLTQEAIIFQIIRQFITGHLFKFLRNKREE